MDALDELFAFCGKHPEIRGHKKLGELFQEAFKQRNDLIISHAGWEATAMQSYHQLMERSKQVDELAVMLSRLQKAQAVYRFACETFPLYDPMIDIALWGLNEAGDCSRDLLEKYLKEREHVQTD